MKNTTPCRNTTATTQKSKLVKDVDMNKISSGNLAVLVLEQIKVSS